jgi:hypothetical protein
MKTRLTVTALFATLIAGNAFAHTHAPETWVTIDSDAPLHATLMPTVSVDATMATSATNPATMRIADVAPLAVTLLPTVHVTARAADELATTLLPTVRVTPTSDSSWSDGATDIADADAAAADLAVVDDEALDSHEPRSGLRVRTMPR